MQEIAKQEYVQIRLDPLRLVPRLFRYRETTYVVQGPAFNYFERRDWWLEDRPNLERIDEEFWRLEAYPHHQSPQHARFYDLKRIDENNWLIVKVWQ